MSEPKSEINPSGVKGFDAAFTQPKPTGNGVDVAVVAAEELRSLGHQKIAEDIEARIRLGERKYGTRLKSHNGRDAVLDLYQEILDGINYAEQCKIEGLDDGGFLASLMGLAVQIGEKLHSRADAVSAADIESVSH